jgi:hypothetical protein
MAGLSRADAPTIHYRVLSHYSIAPCDPLSELEKMTLRVLNSQTRSRNLGATLTGNLF